MDDDRATAQGWDAHAADYAQLFAPFTGHIARSMLCLVQDRLPTKPRILDIACGPGDLSVAAAQLCAQRGGGDVLATDLSPGMVALTQRALAEIDADTRCEVRNGQALGLEGAGFDAAFSSFGIFLFPDRVAGWRSAVEALSPGGVLVTSVWRGPEHNELARMQVSALMGALPAHLTDPPPRAPWDAITTADGLVAEVMASAPVTDPEIHVIDATLVVPSARAMWRGMVGNPLTGTLIAKCAPSERDTVERAVLDVLEERTGGPDRPLLLGSSCHVLVCRRAD